MNILHKKNCVIISGEKGSFKINLNDTVAYRLVMLIEQACVSKSVAETAAQYGISSGRFKQLKKEFKEGGTINLALKKRGPKQNYRRTEEVIKQVVSLRYLDNEISPEVICQRLRQQGHNISVRSVNRIIEDFGLQKKGFINSILKRIKKKKK